MVKVVSTHSRPKAAGAKKVDKEWAGRFQHTAARRRLAFCMGKFISAVSFNTQPPEGGWPPRLFRAAARSRFNTQPPEGGWLPLTAVCAWEEVSTHSRPKAAGLT